MSGKNKGEDMLAKLSAMNDAAVADVPPVLNAGTAPAPAARPTRPTRANPPAATAGPLVKTTVNLVGPSADALQRLQVALMTAAGGTVTASAVVSVALEYAAAQLPTDAARLAELLAGVRQLDGRRRTR